MQGVQRANRLGKRLERASQDWRDQLQEGQAAHERTGRLSVTPPKLPRMHPGPDLVLEEPARYERLTPKVVARATILGEELGQRHGGVNVNHRSLRSASSSWSNSARRATGFRAGRTWDGTIGCLTHPRRTTSASRASLTSTARPGSGGRSSATTRSRSVTRTVSPSAARRTYSLSLFFNALMPTARIPNGSYR